MFELRIIFHLVSMTVLLFTASCDWEKVKNVVTGNISSKPDQLGSEGQGAKQSSNAFLEYSSIFDYLFIYLFILSRSNREATTAHRR